MPDRTVSVDADLYGPLHLWEFVGPYWVRAATEEEARATLERENGKDAYELQRAWPDDQPFTMTYEHDDEIPTGTETDEECVCDPKEREDFGCECDASTPTVTKPAGWWANRMGEEWVIFPYES